MKGHCLNVMVQPPYTEDKVKLPVGLYVQRVYTEMKDGSQNISTVLRNGTGKPMHLAARWLVGHIVAANLVPDAVALPELEAKLAQDREPEPPLIMEQCQKLLMKVLEENGSLRKLKGWKKETALKAKQLLMEFHHIFCLEKNEMGCTDATKHVIELLPEQDEPFKERFRRIAPHEVEEVCQHIQEMLDRGAIQPSQSPWCNAVVLVWKKDGTLRFCIDFRRLNARKRKIHTQYLNARKPWSPWLELNTFPPWTSRAAFGKLRCLRTLASIWQHGVIHVMVLHVVQQPYNHVVGITASSV